MRPTINAPQTDIVMAGTFATWRLGTLQARALPFARELTDRGIRCAIVTVPWDMTSESGVIDTISNVQVRNTGATGVISFPVAVTQMVHEIRALKPRTVHVFKPKGYGGLAGRLLANNTTLVIDSDDWEGDGGWNQHGNYSVFQRCLFDWQERSLLRSATAVTAASYLLKRRALTLRSASPNTVSWVPNGLDPQWAMRLASARPNADETDPHASTVVLYSRFAEFPSDWLPRYIARLSEFLPAGAKIRLAVVGESSTIPIGAGNVLLEQMGYVAYSRLPEILGGSDIAIFPYVDSLITRTKNSVKLLELMAAGCAVVAPCFGDVPAVATDAAFLVGSSDPDVFADATVELHRNRLRVRRLSSAAQQRVVDHFLIPTIADRLVDSYRNAGVLSSCSTG